MSFSWQAVVLSGGSGTRLWPFSRKQYPKQFLDLTGSGHPLLVDTIFRLAPLGEVQVLTTEALRVPTQAVLERDDVRAHVLAEPQPKNTAAAIAYATIRALRSNVDVVGIFPADHAVAQPDVFRKKVTWAMQRAAQGKVLTLGISPTYPSTAFGYIELANEVAPGIRTVTRFIEKPDAEKATALIAQGNVVWNGGIFIFSTRKMAEVFALHMPELWRSMETLAPHEENLSEVFAACPNISVDYGVMEKMTDLECVIAADIGWSDLGSWEDVIERKGEQAMSIRGERNTYIGMDMGKKRPVFIGVNDLVAVDTPDALLVMKKGSGQHLRDAVKALEEVTEPSLNVHVFEERPWGRFEVLHDAAHCKVKKLIIAPGKRISYQRHQHRTEHWTVISGVAAVMINDVEAMYEPGQTIRVEQGAKHRLRNAGWEPLTIVEVQLGTYFGEDDIERFDDDFGRR